MSFNELELKRIDRIVGELCRRSTRPEYAEVRDSRPHLLYLGSAASMGRDRRQDTHGRRPLPIHPFAGRLAALLDAPRPQVAPLR